MNRPLKQKSCVKQEVNEITGSKEEHNFRRHGSCEFPSSPREWRDGERRERRGEERWNLKMLKSKTML